MKTWTRVGERLPISKGILMSEITEKGKVRLRSPAYRFSRKKLNLLLGGRPRGRGGGGP